MSASTRAAAAATPTRSAGGQARSRAVCALDLPGFGRSERAKRVYTPRLMTDAVHAALDALLRRTGAPAVDVLALSLGCEFAARVAAERPQAVRSLALVSPTGFNGTRAWQEPEGATREVPGMHAVLTGPGWGGPLFRALTRPGVVRYFLRRTWGEQAIDEGLWAACVATAREPGAEHAPLQFLCARLFSADVHTVYDRLSVPVWMSHGVRGDFVDYRQKSRWQGRANWRFAVFPTGAIPYFEVPQSFFEAYEAFLEDAASAATHPPRLSV